MNVVKTRKAMKFVLVLLWIFIGWGYYSLAYPQEVWTDSRGGVIPEDQLNQAIWTISQRTGMNMRRMGETEEECTRGKIIVSRATPEAWALQPDWVRRARAYTADCAGGMVIVFHPLTEIYYSLMIHEANHAAGCFEHSGIITDTMNQRAITSFLTTWASSCAITAAFWPQGNPDLCFVERFGNDLYIPSISGKWALLRFQGNGTWLLSDYGTSTINCPGFVYSNGIATLPDVRAFGGFRAAAKLQATGGNWFRLLEVTPH